MTKPKNLPSAPRSAHSYTDESVLLVVLALVAIKEEVETFYIAGFIL